MEVKLCWWDSRNFGDALNPYLFKSLGNSVAYAQSDLAEVIAVGSYMERLLVGAVFSEPQSTEPITAWGTGFQFPQGQHLWFREIRQPEEFIRPVRIHALRGELSKARAAAITGKKLDEIALGDPGLLANRIFKTKAAKKRYRLGVFCHFTDNGNEIFDKITANVKNSVRISVEAPVTDIVRSIASCEAVISSAMHPLIIADSLRVPNRWINVSENAISKYKFDDYYSVFGKKPEFFDLNEKMFDEHDLGRVHAEYSITDERIEAIQEDLIRAAPVPSALRYLTFSDILALRVREALVRDRLVDKAVAKFMRRFENYKNAVRRIAQRSSR